MVQRLSLLHCYRPVDPYLFVEVRQHVSDFAVAVGRDRSHVGDGCAAADFGRLGVELVGNVLDGEIDASLDVCGVEASFDLLEAFLVDGSSKDSGGGSAVPSLVVGLVGHVLNKSSTNVDSLVRKIDSLSHSNSVLGDFGRTVALVDEHVAAARTQRNLDGVGELPAALEKLLAGLGAEQQLLCGVVSLQVEEILRPLSDS